MCQDIQVLIQFNVAMWSTKIGQVANIMKYITDTQGNSLCTQFHECDDIVSTGSRERLAVNQALFLRLLLPDIVFCLSSKNMLCCGGRARKVGVRWSASPMYLFECDKNEFE